MPQSQNANRTPTERQQLGPRVTLGQRGPERARPGQACQGSTARFALFAYECGAVERSSLPAREDAPDFLAIVGDLSPRARGCPFPCCSCSEATPGLSPRVPSPPGAAPPPPCGASQGLALAGAGAVGGRRAPVPQLPGEGRG